MLNFLSVEMILIFVNMCENNAYLTLFIEQICI